MAVEPVRCPHCSGRLTSYVRPIEVDRLRAENEALKAEIKRVDAIARERDDFLFEIGKVLERHDDRLHSLVREAE
jgi:DNA-directed RNA polymerase subunit RPC12/RpoP